MEPKFPTPETATYFVKQVCNIYFVLPFIALTL